MSFTERAALESYRSQHSLVRSRSKRGEKDPMSLDEMNERQFRETVLASDIGTVTIRSERGVASLGLARGNKPHADPEVMVNLTARQLHVLAQELPETIKEIRKVGDDS